MSASSSTILTYQQLQVIELFNTPNDILSQCETQILGHFGGIKQFLRWHSAPDSAGVTAIGQIIKQTQTNASKRTVATVPQPSNTYTSNATIAQASTVSQPSNTDTSNTTIAQAST
eukprot:161042_1